MTISVTEIPKVGVQLPEGAGGNAPVCVTVCTGVGKRLYALPSHPTLGEPTGFSCPGFVREIALVLPCVVDWSQRIY